MTKFTVPPSVEDKTENTFPSFVLLIVLGDLKQKCYGLISLLRFISPCGWVNWWIGLRIVSLKCNLADYTFSTELTAPQVALLCQMKDGTVDRLWRTEVCQ